MSPYGFLNKIYTLLFIFLFWINAGIFASTIDVQEYNLAPLFALSCQDYTQEELPREFVECYTKLQQGNSNLELEELVEALLFIVRETTSNRGSRPDAQLPTDPSAIAGNTCDLTQVLRLLGVIRSRIGSVYQDPSEGTVLGTLGNPLELGPGLNIVRKLLKIQNEFQQTWTILANLTCTATVDLSGVFTAIANISCVATATVDLSGVYTSLLDIKNTLTECCDTIDIEFQETWTILADIKNTVTECCADLHGIFTVLDNLTLSCTAIVDLSGIFTTLTDIKNTLTECCENVEIDLQGVFTVLDNLTLTATVDLSGVFTSLTDIKSTITECCADLQGIFTVLDNLTLTATVDLSGIFTSLTDIKGTLTECCAELQQDFQGVFTVLDHLTLTATVDLSGIFTSLIDIKSTITECCADLQGIFTVLDNLTLSCTAFVDLNGIFTTLTDIKDTLTVCCTTLEQDFNETWTILADIKDTITECCADLLGVFTVLDNLSLSCTAIVDLNGVFTTLTDIKDTLTECCTTLELDFQGVFTVLDNLTLSCTAIVDLNGVFTTLTDIKSTISSDFNQTWTILNDIKGTITVCCADLKATISSDFNQTWTILADIKNSVTLCCPDLSGIYTTLADIKSTISSDFNQTWTILNDIKGTITVCCADLKATISSDFNQTWTILADIKSTISSDFNQTWTILKAIGDCCQGTFTVLADLKATISSDFNQTWTILNALSLSGVYTAVNNLNLNNCSPTFIRQADLGTTGYTINTAGVYKLAENITFSPAAPARAITINTSDVLFDMQCFMLQQGNKTLDVDAIRINSGTVDVIVQNGMVQNFTRAGITVQSATQRIKIRNTSCVNCGVRGIELLGTTVTSPDIRDSLIENVDILLSATFAAATNNGLLVQGARDLQINNCRVNDNGINTQRLSVIKLDNCLKCAFNNVESNDNTAADSIRVFELNTTTSLCSFTNCRNRNNQSTGNSRGFMLVSGSNSVNNEFFNCESLLLSGSATVDGFLTDTGCNNNLFVSCRALVNTSTGASTTDMVHGFNFINNTSNSCIDCIANNNTAPNSTAALSNFGACGFDLNTTFSCNLVRCIAYDQSTGAGSNSGGFRIFNGLRNNITQCQSARQSVGYRVDPNNTTNHTFIQNYATKNTTQYSQFVGGSTQTAGGINNINGSLNNPWTNVSVG